MFITAVFSYGEFCRGCVVGDDRGVEREKYSVLEEKDFIFYAGLKLLNFCQMMASQPSSKSNNSNECCHISQPYDFYTPVSVYFQLAAFSKISKKRKNKYLSSVVSEKGNHI